MQRVAVSDGVIWRREGWQVPGEPPPDIPPPDPDAPEGWAGIVAAAGLSNEAALEPQSSTTINVTVDGAVVENKDLVGAIINVKANNVLVRNCRVNCWTQANVIRMWPGFTGMVVEHCDVSSPINPAVPGKGPSGMIAGNGGTAITVRYCHVHGYNGDGIKAEPGSLIEYNYIHPTKEPGSIVHMDGIQVAGGENYVVIRGNAIALPQYDGGNCCVIAQASNSSTKQCVPLHHVVITGNHLLGGNIPLQVIGGKDIWCDNADLFVTNCTISDNVFYRDNNFLGDDTIRFTQYATIHNQATHVISGNVDDAGAPVVSPFSF